MPRTLRVRARRFWSRSSSAACIRSSARACTYRSPSRQPSLHGCSGGRSCSNLVVILAVVDLAVVVGSVVLSGLRNTDRRVILSSLFQRRLLIYLAFLSNRCTEKLFRTCLPGRTRRQKPISWQKPQKFHGRLVGTPRGPAGYAPACPGPAGYAVKFHDTGNIVGLAIAPARSIDKVAVDGNVARRRQGAFGEEVQCVMWGACPGRLLFGPGEGRTSTTKAKSRSLGIHNRWSESLRRRRRPTCWPASTNTFAASTCRTSSHSSSRPTTRPTACIYQAMTGAIWSPGPSPRRRSSARSSGTSDGTGCSGRAVAHVAAYLVQRDLSAFDPCAVPRQTTAFFEIVNVGQAPEDAELPLTSSNYRTSAHWWQSSKLHAGRRWNGCSTAGASFRFRIDQS